MLTERKTRMKSRYKAVINDKGTGEWEVWLSRGGVYDGWLYKVASFSGIGSQKYSREHARKLNALPERKQP